MCIEYFSVKSSCSLAQETCTTNSKTRKKEAYRTATTLGKRAFSTKKELWMAFLWRWVRGAVTGAHWILDDKWWKKMIWHKSGGTEMLFLSSLHHTKQAALAKARLHLKLLWFVAWHDDKEDSNSLFVLSPLNNRLSFPT